MEVNCSLNIAMDHSDFFSVPDSITYHKIKEFTRQYFKDQMSNLQIQILDKRIFTVISKEENINVFEASDDQVIFLKISRACNRLLVSSKSIWNPMIFSNSDRQFAIYKVIRGDFSYLEELKQDSSVLSSIVWTTNEGLMEEARSLVQSLLTDICRQLSAPILSESDEFHLEMIMGDLLALYPFLKPLDGEIIRLPVKIEGVWCLDDYITDRIELTPEVLGSPLVAYGLRPSSDQATAYLLFKGTTYPTDEGALLSLMTDVNPLGSVGSYGFWLGKDRIQSWIDKISGKIILYGKSLGGALAWRTALNFPDKIQKVMAYGAPGFSPLELSQFYQVKEKYPELEFNFFCQRNDLVPFSDCAATTGVNYYEVISAEGQSNPIAAHADMYSTHECSMVLKLQPEYIQSRGKRAVITIARLAGTVLFPLGFAGVMFNVAYNTFFKK